MKTTKHTTLILVVFLVVLGMIAWWLLATQETAVNKNLVLKLSESDITGFDITKVEANQKIKTVLRKDTEDNWVIAAPVKDITDPGTISIMLASLKEIRTPSIIKNVDDLSKYGLDHPSVTASISLRKGKTVTLNFGSESPIPEMYYAQLAGHKEVVVVMKDIKNNLSPKLSYLRERKVVNVKREQIQELAIGINQSRLYRMLNTNEKWSLIEPYRKELIANDINSIIDGLNALWTHENDDDLNNLAKYGLDRPDYRIEIKLTNGKSFSLIANKVDGDYYMLNSLRPTIIRQKNPDAFNFLNNLQDLFAKSADI